MEIDKTTLDSVWVIIAAVLVFLMQAGFKCLEVGLVREKHATTVAMKNLFDWIVVSVTFYLVGFGLMFGTSVGGWFGGSFLAPQDFSQGTASPLGIFFFIFQLAFVATSATIVSGAMSERTGFVPYLSATLLVALVIYPAFGHWAWGSLFVGGEGGWLEQLGFVDFAGSTVVHSLGAWVSLAGLTLLGPRLGRYDQQGKVKEFKPYNLSYAVLGVFFLWIGWWGFNGGSTLEFNSSVGLIIVNTNLAGALAGVSAYLHCVFFQKREALYEKIIGGVLGGLVAITASAHIQSPLMSMLIGFLAGIVHNVGYSFLLKKLKIDDAVGAIPIHGFCGAFGTIILALTAPLDSLPLDSRLMQLAIQLLGVFVCFVWAGGMSYLMFIVLRKIVGLRVSPEEERLGISIFKVNTPKEEENIDEDELQQLLNQMKE